MLFLFSDLHSRQWAFRCFIIHGWQTPHAKLNSGSFDSVTITLLHAFDKTKRHADAISTTCGKKHGGAPFTRLVSWMVEKKSHQGDAKEPWKHFSSGPSYAHWTSSVYREELSRCEIFIQGITIMEVIVKLCFSGDVKQTVQSILWRLAISYVGWNRRIRPLLF